MTSTRTPTRQRIVNTALDLFARQGITETTTRQIADRAEINEVTLFRHFGNKHGLLLAVMQECLQKYLLFTQVGESLMISEVSSEGDLARFLRYYIQTSLQALESVPELVRSLVGEAGQYPVESRQALAQGIAQVNQSIAHALRDVVAQTHVTLPLPPLKLANLLNTCILGYAVILLTSEAQALWLNREEFVATLVEMIIRDTDDTSRLADISADAVREILMAAKRQGAREYAIAYVLFGAGLKPQELVNLCRQDYVTIAKAQVLKIRTTVSGERLVPINLKILEHRYGSAHNNPLTAYLKTRKDNHESMFLGAGQKALEMDELQHLWSEWTRQLGNFNNLDWRTITILQARQTWGIEMLMRGMDVENFRIIGGFKALEIPLYQRRVREKVAIAQAIALDS